MQMAGEDAPSGAEYPFMAGLSPRMPGNVKGSLAQGYSTKSPHFGSAVSLPHGMIGTVEVEFFGEPSIK